MFTLCYRCYPDNSLSVIACLRYGYDIQHVDGEFLDDAMEDYGWCKINIFDSYNRVLCGRLSTYKCLMYKFCRLTAVLFVNVFVIVQ